MDSWNNLQPREQSTVIAATIVMVLLMGYLFLFEPYLERRDRLELNVVNQQEDLLWMRQAAEQIKQSKKSGAQKGSRGLSLLSFVDQSTKRHKLDKEIKRIQPEGSKVRVSFEEISFRKVVGWLSDLEKSGYSVNGAVIERTKEPGMVNARIVIEQRS
ncbi:MAG: hypothetical protein GQ470_01560 [Gammaproteobacteria bacterium]|nr:hypothetical protein [Gammaproteobacteria bacterium]